MKVVKMHSIMDSSIIHHACIVLLLLWLLNCFNRCHPVAYFLSLIYLFLVHERYVMRLRRRLQFEEKRQSNQRRVLSDSETVRWLNHAVEKIWGVCMEEIVSQKILLPIVPWFLQKYKPWTVKDAAIQHLYLGRSPPIFTEMRVLRESNNDDHFVLELGINFRTAEDMSAIVAVKLRKRFGFGMRAKLHLLGMHIEGKVLIGVKFISKLPFLGRLRVCFSEPPYFQMTIKPIFTHGLDVTMIPGIAGWLDKLLSLAFEQTLVEPNMLVVDVEKFASPQQENWFSVDTKEPIAQAVVEVLEAADLKPSDLNGLADPYVKGQLGPYRFQTKTRKKTLSPKWQEEFKISICSWEFPNVLNIEVLDKDHIFDDALGDCCVNINDFRDGLRHSTWLSLQNVKMGRLRLAITVSEGNRKRAERACDIESLNSESKRNCSAAGPEQEGSPSSRSSEKSANIADEFEPIDIEWRQETGIWIHHPGCEVVRAWEPRKAKSGQLEGHVQGISAALLDSSSNFKSTVLTSTNKDGSSTDGSMDANKAHSEYSIRKGLQKISSVFHRSPSVEANPNCLEVPELSLQNNTRPSNTQDIDAKLINEYDKKENWEGSGPRNPHKRPVKVMAKRFLKHAGKSANGLKHAISRKAARKSKGEFGSSPTDRDVALSSDSSEEGSLASLTDVHLAEADLLGSDSVISSPASVSVNNSFKSRDSIFIHTANDRGINNT